jgi:membrane protease YdiL (CAAX protease family)
MAVLVHSAEPRRPGWGLLGIGVAIIWGFDLAVGVIYVVARAALEGPKSLNADMGPIGILIATLLSSAATVSVIWFITCRQCGWRFADGFAVRSVKWPVIALSVVLGLLTALAAGWIESRWGSEQSMMARLASMPGGLVAISTVALVVPPFEELYYRGFIFPTLRGLLGPWAAVLLTAAWFTGAHVFQLAGDPAGLAIILTMGLTWTLQRQLTDSLIPGLITHWLYNAVLVTLSLAGS